MPLCIAHELSERWREVLRLLAPVGGVLDQQVGFHHQQPGASCTAKVVAGEFDLGHHIATLAKGTQRLAVGGGHFASDTQRVDVAGRHPARCLDPGPRRCGAGIRAGGVEGADDGQHGPQVATRSNDGADMVQRAAAGHRSACGDQAVAGLEADHAAIGGGDAQRAQRVAAQRQCAQAGGHGAGRAAARATRCVAGAQRVLATAVVRVVVGGAERGLVHVELAHNDHPGLAQEPHHEGIGSSNSPTPGGHAGRAGHADDVDVVLDGQCQSVQRAACRACRPARVARHRSVASSGRVDVQIGVEPPVAALNRRQHQIGQCLAGDVAARQRLRLAGEVLHQECVDHLNRLSIRRIGFCRLSMPVKAARAWGATRSTRTSTPNLRLSSSR